MTKRQNIQKYETEKFMTSFCNQNTWNSAQGLFIRLYLLTQSKMKGSGVKRGRGIPLPGSSEFVKSQ